MDVPLTAVCSESVSTSMPLMVKTWWILMSTLEVVAAPSVNLYSSLTWAGAGEATQVHTTSDKTAARRIIDGTPGGKGRTSNREAAIETRGTPPRPVQTTPEPVRSE